MNKERITAFTLRIASSNGSGLISILYDIYEEYEAEALDAFEAEKLDLAVEAIKKCSEVVSHLQRDLNFDYSVSKDLYALYDFVQRALARSIYKGDAAGIIEAKTVMDRLKDAFLVVAKADTREPLMKNTQKVMAGCTYGRSSLNENLMGNQSSRGFWA